MPGQERNIALEHLFFNIVDIYNVCFISLNHNALFKLS